jgi:rhodanese-related sulfurtransferase
MQLTRLVQALSQIVAIAVVEAGCAKNTTPRDLTVVRARVAAAYADVPRISTADLATWMNDRSRPPPLLLDARSREEYQVSHLNGAFCTDEAASRAALDRLPNDAPIVAYCSVGYRSAALARRLRHAGFTRVWNLDGSIFQWANEGRAVYRDGHEVSKVHPYDAGWAGLLEQRVRYRTPASARTE